MEDVEDEVDQLVSDAEEEAVAPPPPPMTKQQDQLQEDAEPTASEINVSAIKKTKTGKLERTPGHSLLPQGRLDSILQAEGTFGTLSTHQLVTLFLTLLGAMGNLSMSKEATFVLSIATVSVY